MAHNREEPAAGDLGSFGKKLFFDFASNTLKRLEGHSCRGEHPRPALLAGMGVQACKESFHTLPGEPQCTWGSQGWLLG